MGTATINDAIAKAPRVRTIGIDLDQADEHLRWEWLRDATEGNRARAMCAEFLDVMGGPALLRHRTPLSALFRWRVGEKYRREVDTLAGMLYLDPFYLRVLNMYYDLANLKTKLPEGASLTHVFGKSLMPFGCSSIVYNGEDGPVHIRNLDWPSERGSLAESSAILHFISKKEGKSYKLLSWPGLSGTYTGIRDGAFTLSTNAVVSDVFYPGEPVPMLLRRVLDEASTYDEALKMLTEARILADCLITISGTKRDEMAIVERTPKDAVVRGPENGYINVSNHYEAYKGRGLDMRNEISESSSARFCRARELMDGAFPSGVEECYSMLWDPGVRQAITMQSVVMCAATGHIDARQPPHEQWRAEAE